MKLCRYRIMPVIVNNDGVFLWQEVLQPLGHQLCFATTARRRAPLPSRVWYENHLPGRTFVQKDERNAPNRRTRGSMPGK